jgi:predicted  nucleic acid-binding Zn-ribbon protein
MSDDTDFHEGEGLRERLSRQGEDALARLVSDLLENPIVSGTISRVFGARDRAIAAQESAMGALNLPSAADLERLTRRVRSLGQRLEGIEDGVDRVDDRMGNLAASIEKLNAEITDMRAAAGAAEKGTPAATQTESAV